MSALKGMDLISAAALERATIEEVIGLAAKMDAVFRRKERLSTLKGKVLCSMFYEPSTRTQFSFNTAMRQLGGDAMGFSEPKSTSFAKGETLYDTIRALGPQADAFVIRHPSEGSAALAAAASDVPVINAGDGNNQHPTQALLDLYTIKKSKKEIDGITVLFAGDLKYGRTVHSLSYALCKFQDITIQYYSPPQLRMPEFMLKDLREHAKVKELSSFDLSQADVVYATRIQKERIEDPEEYKRAAYRIDAEMMKSAKPDAMLMHPLPRVDEIAVEVDSDPRAKYFEQESNGIPTRMAILQLILG
ncbi:MAG: aspartate carbamoyltransferase [Candidatus Micrarchaeota archaeon]